MDFQKTTIIDGVTVIDKTLLDKMQDGIIEAIQKAEQDAGGGEGGGEGGSAQIEVDATLTQSGKAADAKAVGDAIVDLERLIGASGGGYMSSDLAGKKVSIIGDSITTFAGYIPNGYSGWYPQGDVDTVDKTWWKQVINATGMELLVNAAWAGCKVVGNSADTSSASAACSTKRIQDLSKNGVTPDIVMVMCGINDFDQNVGVGSWDGTSLPQDGNISTFSEAYAMMVSKIMAAYPMAEVCLCTILECGKIDKKIGFPLERSDGLTVKAYNDAIRFIADCFGCVVLDTHSCGWNYYNIMSLTHDGTHPNVKGGAMVARKAIVDLCTKSRYATKLNNDPSNPIIKTYTVTYKYVDEDGLTIRQDETYSVTGGTTINISNSDAPSLGGYVFSSVQPSGQITVNSNTVITFTYKEEAETPYFTVTYKYVDGSGRDIHNQKTERYAQGTQIQIGEDDAPDVEGYNFVRVSPEGSIAVNGEMTITFTYAAKEYVTVTYVYQSAGLEISKQTTKQFEKGTQIQVEKGDAPSIEGYIAVSVSPSGTITLNENTTITFVYNEAQTEWYTDFCGRDEFDTEGVLSSVPWAYQNSDTIAKYVGKPINAIRLACQAPGPFYYGKCKVAEMTNPESYTELGVINLESQTKTPTTYMIEEFTLEEGENVYFGKRGQTGTCYMSNVKSDETRFIYSYSGSSNGNLSIDVGYIS